MARLLSLFLVVWMLFGVTGCASTKPEADDPDRISRIPWNRPEKWERQGALGSMFSTN
jgi:hypothetical protein